MTKICICCGDKASLIRAKKRGYSMCECPSCGLVFVDNQPTSSQLKDLYVRAQGYFGTASEDFKNTDDTSARKISSILNKYGVVNQNFYDAGCSTGKLIYHLRKIGWNVAGCDLNAEAVSIGKKHGLEMSAGDINTVNIENNKYGVIHFGDVIEHVQDPLATINNAHRLLINGGVIFIKVPNGASGFAVSTKKFANLTGMPWLHSEAPYHLYEFTPASLQSLLAKSGFRDIAISAYGKLSFIYIVGGSGYFDELKRELKSTGRYSVKFIALRYLHLLFAVSIITLPFYIYSLIFSRIYGKGRSLIVLARKVE